MSFQWIRHFICGWGIVISGLLQAEVTFPRLPLPPLLPPWLQAWRFDDPDWLQDTELAPLSLRGVEWVPSWSGYALHITGRGPGVCLLPLEPSLSGQTPGSLRVWFAPDWSSQSAGGTGPRLPATLLQSGDNGWRVTTDGAGNTLQFLAVGSLPWIELIQAPIAWRAGQWHQLALSWAPGEPTVLWLDGVPVGTGPELPPAVDSRLWLGGDPTGLLLARGELDELYTYDHSLGVLEIAKDYAAYAPQAALGPVSRQEHHQLEKLIREKFKQTRRDRRNPPPREEVNPGCGVWLTATDVDETLLLLLLYNTVPGKNYRLETSPTYLNPEWVFFRDVQGEVGTVVVEVDTTGQTMGFFRVVFEPPPMFGFEGLGFAQTLVDPPDIATAVGPSHILQLLNGKVAIFRKTGGDPIETLGLSEFFGLTTAVDPRVFYDHPQQRWVASALDRDSRTVVMLAVSKGPEPLNLTEGWNRYPINLTLPRGDFPTLGMDANGVYLAVNFRPTRQAGFVNHVYAFRKNQLYQGTFNPTMFEVNPGEIDTEAIQPALSFDANLPDGAAWFMTKGPPDPGPPYRGGAIFYRRIVWVGTQAQWLDVSWNEVSATGINYRNYFDIPFPSVRAPQKGAEGGGLDIAIDFAGSRLCQPVLRNGQIWVAQHVGASGPTGAYLGGSSGQGVDRSAVQWFQLEINPTGVPLSVAQHGRIFDPSASAPVWYHFPSLTVNGVGDCLIGFSGSGTATHLSAYFAWKAPPALNAGPPQLLQAGQWLCIDSRGADYSSTCVDPSDDGVLWTFQEHAATNDRVEDLNFHTSAARLLCPK